jgi:hypothetical protein
MPGPGFVRSNGSVHKPEPSIRNYVDLATNVRSIIRVPQSDYKPNPAESDVLQEGELA